MRVSVNVDVRKVQSPQVDEIYISATPARQAPIKDKWREVFAGIREALVAGGGYILQERIFATESEIDSACKQRLEEYRDIDDGVSPSILICKEGFSGSVGGVQVYAVKCEDKPDVVDFEGGLCGRIVKVSGRQSLMLSNISSSQDGSDVEQAQAMLEKSEAILQRYNSDFRSVPRTWMWLGDILSWYGQFNSVRNKLFTDCGIITADGIQKLPASTGIGLAPADRGCCCMDLVAILEPSDSIKYLPSAGKQHCAFEYGSAFSRATEAIMPAGKTVFVSGTASIDINGATTNLGNPLGQIKETIENVRAILSDMQYVDSDVMQAIAYCKTAEVEKVFEEYKSDLNWPWIKVVCDICRPELLFEVEIAAASSA